MNIFIGVEDQKHFIYKQKEHCDVIQKHFIYEHKEHCDVIQKHYIYEYKEHCDVIQKLNHVKKWVLATVSINLA